MLSSHLVYSSLVEAGKEREDRKLSIKKRDGLVRNADGMSSRGSKCTYSRHVLELVAGARGIRENRRVRQSRDSWSSWAIIA